MTILLLTKQKPHAYERRRIEEEFRQHDLAYEVRNPKQFDIVLTEKIGNSVKFKGKDFPWPGLVLLRSTAGENNFNLTLLREFEQALVPTINPPDAIERSRDKLRAGQLLANHGLAIPKTMMFRFPVDYDIIETEIGYPCVVKVTTGSLGNGVYLCYTKREFKKLIAMAVDFGNRQTLIVQEYLGERIGEDLRVIVIGGKVLGAMHRKSAKNDFRANIAKGGTGEPYPVSDEIDYISREAVKVLGLDIAGVDLLFDPAGFKVCEVNSNPGFSGFERYCNINVAGAIANYVKFRTQ